MDDLADDIVNKIEELVEVLMAYKDSGSFEDQAAVNTSKAELKTLIKKLWSAESAN